MHWPPAGAGNRSSRPGGGGRQASARLRAEENASFLSHPHTLRAPRSRAADRQGHVRKRRRMHKRGAVWGEVQKRLLKSRAAQREKVPKQNGRGAGETMRRGGVGETVQGRRCKRDGAGERRCRGETMQGRRCSTPGKSRTAHPRNKNHGLPENHDLPGKPGSP